MKSAQHRHKITLTFEQCLKFSVTAHREIAVVERTDKLTGFWFLLITSW